MNDRFNAMQTFVRVARSGSFSTAARDLGMTQPTASRIVAALEKHLGAELLARSTRKVTLTEAGTDYLARCDDILSALAEADHAVRGTGELQGTLRIAASLTFATRTIIPHLADFADKHPKLQLDLILDDERHDLIGRSVDVAVRVGPLPDSSLVGRKVGVLRRILGASPEYLKRAGTPCDPSELTRHSLIIGPAGRHPEGWTFTRDGETSFPQIFGRIVIDATEAATAAAVAGLGIISATDRSIAAELTSGSLVRLFHEWEMSAADINVIWPSGRKAKPSARAFADFISTKIRDVDIVSDPDPTSNKTGTADID
jgi:DNA-binding transcriptional LysR family regulator